MSLSAISAFLPQLEVHPSRDLLTIVLSGGCNLKCSWCAVNARGERQDGPATFNSDDYCNLINGLTSEELISGVAIVGDEPLLDEAWPTAKSILIYASRNRQLPTALITNGTKLAERSEELVDCDSTIIVSLDGTGAYHDKTRRVDGAYDALIRGFEAVSKRPALQSRIVIASVVQPDKYEYLADIPKVAARYGIKRWVLSPLIQFHRNKQACLHPRLFPAVFEELPRLIELGQMAGIKTEVDDSFCMLRFADHEGRLADQHIEYPPTPDVKVLRMRPDGLTVRYADLLRTDISRGLHWDGVEPPARFYHRLYARELSPAFA